jgi:hypothetical protein
MLCEGGGAATNTAGAIKINLGHETLRGVTHLTIGEETQLSCANAVTSLTFSGTNSTLTTLVISDNTFRQNAAGKNNVLASIRFPSGIGSLSIGANAFRQEASGGFSNALTSVVFPAGLSSLSIADNAFAATSLRYLEFESGSAPGNGGGSITLGSNIVGTSGAWWLWRGADNVLTSDSAGWGSAVAGGSTAYTLHGVRKLVYDANGGTGEPTTEWFIARNLLPNPTDTQRALLYEAPVTTQFPTRDGYVATSWNTQANGLGTSYASGGRVQLPAAGITLFAHWQAAPAVTGGVAQISLGGTASFTERSVTTGVVKSAVVSSAPAAPAVAAVDKNTGVVTFNARTAPAGKYTFAVTWTDNLNQTATASYTVTIQAAPTLPAGVAGIKVIPVGGATEFSTALKSEGVIVSGKVVTSPAAGSVSVTWRSVAGGAPGSAVTAIGDVRFTAGNAAAGDYSFVVVWTDSLNQGFTVEYDVKIQAPPVVSNGVVFGEVLPGGKVLFKNVVRTTGVISEAVVSVKPSAGTVSANVSGVVTFSADKATPGNYPFVVTWVDNLQQVSTAKYEVKVKAAPTTPNATVPDEVVSGGVLPDETPTSGGNSGEIPDEVVSGGVFPDEVAPGEVTPDDGGVVPDEVLSAKVIPGGTVLFENMTLTTAEISEVSVVSEPSAGTVHASVADGVMFAAGDAAAGNYSFMVLWVDSWGQSFTVKYEVQVQAPPTVPKGVVAGKVVPGGRVVFENVVHTTGIINEVILLAEPSVGSVHATVDGVVTFTAANDAAPGSYNFLLSWIDDLAQSAVSEFSVTVERNVGSAFIGDTLQAVSNGALLRFALPEGASSPSGTLLWAALSNDGVLWLAAFAAVLVAACVGRYKRHGERARVTRDNPPIG